MEVEIISARPEDTDFIAWIVAQGMHMDSVPPFLKKLGARDDTLYSWKRTRLLRCDGKLAGGLVSYDGATHEEGRRNTWVMPDGRLLSSGDVPETTAGEYYLDSLAIVPELAKLYTSYGFVPENTFLYFDTLCRKMSLSI
ncbi:MAG: hypothetical protein IJ647_11985 [Prevotella sp.]|nr:hypothetical protein [Prevotella sp.]